MEILSTSTDFNSSFSSAIVEPMSSLTDQTYNSFLIRNFSKNYLFLA